jgi:RHS repeat-associated protein
MTSGPKPGSETTRHKYVYDAWNRLVKVMTAADAVVSECRYDALNRRIRKFTDKDGDTWTVREYYYNSQWQNLEVRRDTRARSGSPVPEPEAATAVCEQYVWSPRYVDAPVLRDRDADGNSATGDYGGDGNPNNGVTGLEERSCYTSDGNGNVTALASAAGAVAERYVYDPYGKVTIYTSVWAATVAWADSKKNEVLYGGYRFDSETGLYHVRHRVYHVTLGRWMQRDPQGYVDGISLYEYVCSSPVTMYDTLGLGYTMLLIAEGDPELQNAKPSPQRGMDVKRVDMPLPPGKITKNVQTAVQERKGEEPDQVRVVAHGNEAGEIKRGGSIKAANQLWAMAKGIKEGLGTDSPPPLVIESCSVGNNLTSVEAVGREWGNTVTAATGSGVIETGELTGLLVTYDPKTDAYKIDESGRRYDRKLGKAVEDKRSKDEQDLDKINFRLKNRLSTESPGGCYKKSDRSTPTNEERAAQNELLNQRRQLEAKIRERK